MNTRHQIMQDRDFWVTLAFDMCGLLTESQNNKMRSYWIDDLIPQGIEDTKTGVEVSGVIWVAQHRGPQTSCRFLATIPQKLLYKQVRDFDYEIIMFDIEKKFVEISISVSEDAQSG